MASHVLAQLGLTRDSLLWFWGKLVAVVLALAGLAQMGQAGASILAHMGIHPAWQPYILLAAFIVGIFSGHYSTSPLPGEHDANTVSRPTDQRGFFLIPPAVAIAVAALAVGGILAIAHVHVPILNPQTKIQAAKTDRVLFESVRAVQVEEEKLFKNGSVPALHATQADGKTLHQHIAAEELVVYHLIERVALALQKMPVGGSLSLTDLGFVTDLEHAVADLISLVRPVLGESFASAVDEVAKYAAQFSTSAKAVK